ncbi:thiopurine S-methyltransferase [Adonisia turfae]|uniref:Thiopurine S-methyltransferase n=1 Tax=Adonisia turfae CCMR0081 TaxID=2292702 RepID=A0A6M0RYW1_9CYAN|nr:thiopurine S-methyltransferase [Adonisia turfae]NEZ60871.1 thiopurine S-methyltransferase [Adonisia turfae CCMR0081]
MDTSFWLQRWENNNITFHRSDANPVLVNYFQTLSLMKDSRVFVPLCGKTRDIAWLLSNGYRVAGAELVEMAVEQLFMELELEPTISDAEEVKHYSAKNIDIFVGNIFDVSSQILGPIDAVYDRAALVALPEDMRNQYSAHLMEVTTKAPQLLISYEYDQTLMAGPPFSVSNEEVNQHYGDSYDLNLLVSTDIVGGLKGKCAAKKNIWLLKNT